MKIIDQQKYRHAEKPFKFANNNETFRDVYLESIFISKKTCVMYRVYTMTLHRMHQI